MNTRLLWLNIWLVVLVIPSSQALAVVRNHGTFNTGTATPIDDLCAPCTGSNQCLSGLCFLFGDPNITGICTQGCSADGLCPTQFSCVTTPSPNYCAPDSTTYCATYYLGPGLNDTCLQPASQSDPNSGYERTCQAQAGLTLTCYTFASGTGACLQQCSSIDPSQTCPVGQTCCFGQDSEGHCATSTASNSVGACFDIQHVGDSCAIPNQGVCDSQTECYYTSSSAADSECYNLCDSNGNCSVGETCLQTTDSSGNSVNLCCDALLLNPNDDVSTCVPLAGPCLRQIGVQCLSNADCQEGLCLQNGSKSACSRVCASDSDCAIPAGVSGVSNPPPQNSCIKLGNQNTMCWPNGGPGAIPSCANTVTTSKSSGSGCGGCANNQGSQDSLWPSLFIATLLFRRGLWRVFAKYGQYLVQQRPRV